jgi:hypothetical protein
VKEPLVGGDVSAIYGAYELVELFVVDLGEYRNTPQCGPPIGRTRFARLLFSGHEVSPLGSRLAPATPETQPVSGYLLLRGVGSSADVAAEIAISGQRRHVAQFTGSPLRAKALRGDEFDA